ISGAETEMARVNGYWLPADMVRNWPKVMDQIAQGQQQASGMNVGIMLAGAEPFVKPFENAQSQKEFHTAVDQTMQMVGPMLQAFMPQPPAGGPGGGRGPGGPGGPGAPGMGGDPGLGDYGPNGPGAGYEDAMRGLGGDPGAGPGNGDYGPNGPGGGYDEAMQGGGQPRFPGMAGGGR
ncbi:MAG: hypothetical protein AAFP90_21700, partial [Planctomycetota bacterium]